MTPAQRKLHRLNRLEKLRDIAKQTAATEVARAESTLAQLQGLADRTRALAQDYASRTDSQSGADLRLLGHFATGLAAVQAITKADVARAQAHADRRQAELAQAELRRSAVETRATEAANLISREAATRALAGGMAARRALGTDLD